MRDDERDVVDFDVDAVLATAREAVGERRLLVCVVYDVNDFGTVYVDDRIDALYEDENARTEHFGEIHSYVHLDFTEGKLFEELFLEPDGVRAFVTYMGNLVAVRIVADEQGVFLAVPPGTPVTDLVDAVEAVLQ